VHGVYSTARGLQCRKRYSMFIILVILAFRRIVKIRDFKFEEWMGSTLRYPIFMRKRGLSI
jgi:hypothetical protein